VQVRKRSLGLVDGSERVGHSVVIVVKTELGD